MPPFHLSHICSSWFATAAGVCEACLRGGARCDRCFPYVLPFSIFYVYIRIVLIPTYIYLYSAYIHTFYSYILLYHFYLSHLSQNSYKLGRVGKSCDRWVRFIWRISVTHLSHPQKGTSSVDERSARTKRRTSFPETLERLRTYPSLSITAANRRPSAGDTLAVDAPIAN